MTASRLGTLPSWWREPARAGPPAATAPPLPAGGERPGHGGPPERDRGHDPCHQTEQQVCEEERALRDEGHQRVDRSPVSSAVVCRWLTAGAHRTGPRGMGTTAGSAGLHRHPMRVPPRPSEPAASAGTPALCQADDTLRGQPRPWHGPAATPTSTGPDRRAAALAGPQNGRGNARAAERNCQPGDNIRSPARGPGHDEA